MASFIKKIFKLLLCRVMINQWSRLITSLIKTKSLMSIICLCLMFGHCLYSSELLYAAIFQISTSSQHLSISQSQTTTHSHTHTYCTDSLDFPANTTACACVGGSHGSLQIDVYLAMTMKMSFGFLHLLSTTWRLLLIRFAKLENTGANVWDIDKCSWMLLRTRM